MTNYNSLRIFDILLVLFCQITCLSAQTVYVKPGGIGDGSSWVNASGDLQAAMLSAQPGTQIWVAFGTYTPVSCSSCDFSARNAHFQLMPGTEVYGGFAGTETDLSERDPVNLTTVLSGDIDGDGTLNNNSYSVLYTRDLTLTAVLDGFTISDGNADNPDQTVGNRYRSGGGWFNDGSLSGYFSHPTVRNCIFKDNFAIDFGAGMTNDGSFGGSSSPVLENCQFADNISAGHGGAVYNNGSFTGETNATFTDCIFTENISQSGSGGAVFVQVSEGGVSNTDFANCTFTDNYALEKGGAINIFAKNGQSYSVHTECVFENNSAEAGGAVANDGSLGGVCNPTYEGCLFKSNTAFNSDGGAIFNFGALGGNCSPTVVNCNFENNSSEYAGAAVFNNAIEGLSSPVLTNCRFTENTAGTYGGAIYNQGKTGNSSPQITNCLFYNNGAASAGAIYNLGSVSGNSSPVITNCTFYANYANVGGAIYNNAGDETGNSSPLISNCIIYGNTAPLGPIFRNIHGTPVVKYSLIDAPNCEAANSNIEGSINCGAGMLYDLDPGFYDAESGNLHISDPDSPVTDSGENAAIDQTNVETDLDNLPRIHNGTVDMGVFEFGSVADNTVVVIQQPADFSGCAGVTVTLTTEAVSASDLNYQWLKDGETISGATEQTYTLSDAEPAHTGIYECIISNADGISTETDAATVEISPITDLTVNVTASETAICTGETVIFSAEVPGGNPADLSYQWYINGNAFGGDIAQFNMEELNDGDAFYAEVTSVAACLANSVAVSETVVINVSDAIMPTVLVQSAADTVLCLGEQAVFYAEISGGGTTPQFQWTVNNEAVGENAAEFITTDLSDGDVISCLLMSSAECATEVNVISNNLTAEVADCSTATENLVAEKNIIVFPNPARQTVYVKIASESRPKTLRLTDGHGRLLQEKIDLFYPENLRFDISALSSGVYFLEMITDKGQEIERVVILR